MNMLMSLSLQTVLWIALSLTPQATMSESIQTYFLNSDHTFRNPLPNACLHTDPANIIPLPSQLTFCLRMQPMVHAGQEDPWSTIVGFGTINTDFTGLEEGIAFGTWETGPWIGVKNKTNTDYVWIGLGKNFMRDVQIWRHTCFSINFDTGHMQLFENGEEQYKTQSDLIQRTGLTMNHVSAGCLYDSTSATLGAMSMYGRVTDIQIFGTILSDLMMEEITGCKLRYNGDLLSWDSTEWVMSGPKQSIRKENLNFKVNIYANL